MTKHTPTPWMLNSYYEIVESGCEDPKEGKLIIAHVNTPSLEKKKGNAEFIVRACNSHEALVQAANTFLAYTPNDFFDIRYQEARQALANVLKLAEGE